MSRIHVLVLASTLLAAPPARADEPKFEYGKHAEVKDVKGVEWKASAQGGLILTTGNSQVTTASLGADVSRRQGNNKFQLSLGGAYAKSDVFIAVDKDMNGSIDFDTEVERQS